MLQIYVIKCWNDFEEAAGIFFRNSNKIKYIWLHLSTINEN